MNIYELIGIIIGDGHIGYNKNSNRRWLEICGNVKEMDYFKKISELLFKLTKKKPIIVEKQERDGGRGLRLYLNNKDFFNFLTKEIGLPFGKKTFSIAIPKKFLSWKFSKHILRGIFDTDGSIYFSYSKKTKHPTYPRVEIKTSSNNLAPQIFGILKRRGFKIRLRFSKDKRINILYLSGQEMADKWFKEVGSSNNSKIDRYKFWKERGYFIVRKNL